MKHYVLISNNQRDVEFQYADFFVNPELTAVLFKFNRIRVGMIRVIDILHFRSNKIIKGLFFNQIFRRELDGKIKKKDSEEYVFIVVGRVYEKYGTNLIEYLRMQYPTCNIVLYMVDLISTMRFSLQKAKEEFDILFSFDEKDAEENGIEYLLEPFSTGLLGKISHVDNPEFDVTCVSAAKNRYTTIISCYEELKKRGLKCDFHIVGVKRREQKYKDEIHYGWIDFEEVLNHVVNSKSVLEVVQKEEWSATTRYSEAMLLGRNLLTNCKALNEEENRESSIFYFSKVDEIPFENISVMQKTDLEKYQKKFSIKSFLETIEQHLLTNGINHDADIRI